MKILFSVTLAVGFTLALNSTVQAFDDHAIAEEHAFRADILEAIIEDAQAEAAKFSVDNYYNTTQQVVTLYTNALKAKGVSDSDAARDIAEIKNLIERVRKIVPSPHFKRLSGIGSSTRDGRQSREILKSLAVSVIASLNDAAEAKSKGDLDLANHFAAQTLALISYAHVMIGKFYGTSEGTALKGVQFYGVFMIGVVAAMMATPNLLHSLPHVQQMELISAEVLALTPPLVLFTRNYWRQGNQRPGVAIPKFMLEKEIAKYTPTLVTQFWNDVNHALGMLHWNTQSFLPPIPLNSGNYSALSGDNKALSEWIMKTIVETSESPLTKCGILVNL